MGDPQKAAAKLDGLGVVAHPASLDRELRLQADATPGGQDGDVGRLADVCRHVIGDGAELSHELGVTVAGDLVPGVNEAVSRLLAEPLVGREHPDENLVEDRLQILPDQGCRTARVEGLGDLGVKLTTETVEGVLGGEACRVEPEVERDTGVLDAGLLGEQHAELGVGAGVEGVREGHPLFGRDVPAACRRFGGGLLLDALGLDRWGRDVGRCVQLLEGLADLLLGRDNALQELRDLVGGHAQSFLVKRSTKASP